MKARYIKPEISISEVEFEDVIATLSVSNEDHNGAFNSKGRGDDVDFEEDNTVWGNLWD